TAAARNSAGSSSAGRLSGCFSLGLRMDLIKASMSTPFDRPRGRECHRRTFSLADVAEKPPGARKEQPILAGNYRHVNVGRAPLATGLTDYFSTSSDPI